MRKSGSILALAVLAATLSAPAQAALVCHPPMQGNLTGILPSKDIARNTARGAWRIKVTAKWGPAWASWGNSRDRKYACARRTNVLGANGWVCRARAKPCMFQ